MYFSQLAGASMNQGKNLGRVFRFYLEVCDLSKHIFFNRGFVSNNSGTPTTSSWLVASCKAAWPNSANLNLYRDGRQGVGWTFWCLHRNLRATGAPPSMPPPPERYGLVKGLLTAMIP